MHPNTDDLFDEDEPIQASVFTDAMDEWASTAPAKKRKGCPKVSSKRIRQMALDMAHMAKTGVYTGTQAGHLVALYSLCHERVYGTSPTELEMGDAFYLASNAARRMVNNEFAGDYERAIEFMRWNWNREREREKWRRQNASTSTFRLSWKLQFSSSAVSDYRVTIARTGGLR